MCVCAFAISVVCTLSPNSPRYYYMLVSQSSAPSQTEDGTLRFVLEDKSPSQQAAQVGGGACCNQLLIDLVRTADHAISVLYLRTALDKAPYDTRKYFLSVVSSKVAKFSLVAHLSLFMLMRS